MIHDGTADQGHYYSYNYDITNQVWRKYNDINVTEEPDENKIMQEAQGLNQKSAYCLVYAAESVLYGEKLLNVNEFSSKIDAPTNKLPLAKTNSNNFALKYENMISDDLRNYVQIENKQFKELADNFKLIRSASQIVDQYVERFTHINQQIRLHNDIALQRNNQYPPAIMNFATYLRSEDKYKEEYFKWHLLDLCIKKVSNNQVNIHDLGKYELFVEQIKSNFQCLSQFQTITKLKLSQTESTCLDTALTNYIEQYLIAELSLEVLKLCINFQWIESLNLAGYIYCRTQNLPKMNYFRSMNLEIIRIIGLTIAQLIFQLDENDFDKMGQYLDALISNLFYLLRNDIIIQQIDLMLREFIIKYSENKNIKDFITNYRSIIQQYSKQDSNLFRKDFQQFDSYITEKESQIEQLRDKIMTEKDFCSWEINQESIIKEIMNQVNFMLQTCNPFINLSKTIIKEQKLVNYGERFKMGLFELNLLEKKKIIETCQLLDL